MLSKLVGALCALAQVRALDKDNSFVLPLLDIDPHSPEAKKADAALAHVMDGLLAEWKDQKQDEVLQYWLHEIESSAGSFLQSRAATAYKTIPNQPVCAGGAVSKAVAPTAVSAYPGGVAKRLFGFDLTKLMTGLASKAQGPAAAAAGIPGMLALQSLTNGAGLTKSILNVVLQVVPPMIPPPVWNNQPLPCVPLVVGKNCLGATPYLIPIADLMTADTTDAALDGVVAGFPAMYSKKVGKTSDVAYRTCFSAVMSLQCASVFPRCSVPQSSDFPAPTGRLPLCFFHCIGVLVACPGMWIQDIPECTGGLIAPPPMCTAALFMNYALLPPQYQSYEESTPEPMECPQTPASLMGSEAGTDFSLYSTPAIEASAYASSATTTAATALPIA